MREADMATLTSITFMCPDDLAERLRTVAFERDKSASEIIRSCIILALPSVLAVRGLDRLCVEDIRAGGTVHKKKPTTE
jgi:predicted transcriptional regulator